MRNISQTFLVLLVLNSLAIVSSEFASISSHPEDSADDNIGTDLDGMKKLFKDTLANYDTRIRPREDQSQVVHVTTKFVPQSILEFDTSEQKFSVLGYFRIHWTDEVITWNPADYAQTNTIKVPVTEIWTPSLIILKAFDGDGVVGNSNTDIAKISDVGYVQWVPEGIYSVVCHVDIKYYPFDEQTCIITYYVSDETITTVELDHPSDVNLDEYTANSAWRIASISQRRYLLYNTYHIDVEFKVQRRANFATFTLIMPLLMLAFLNVCIFLVPVGSGEKGSFAITIFLSYGIFVTIVSDTLPDNSLQISYFLLFIIVLLFMSVLSVLYTIIQAKLMSSIGDKECSINCLRPKKRSISNNKVIPFDQDDAMCNTNGKPEVCTVDVDAENEDDDKYTWAMFLEKLDSILFVVFLGLALVLSSGFFSLMLRRLSESTLQDL
ncbi:acetylcholine receptor subunit beta-type unc-29-like isoform X1 [Ruditapes philippinarum]|uniref:acetylcholine receptor subunit beta-type unc-29-like isoform X1 n=1 Tax=Ruditapes philippinarum TaxID=129788 RepID=UPI00295BF719|nr:acetylcholine receptor subunit beta-type unc-29-like isoform X1 [Ruditapes philippinarum]